MALNKHERDFCGPTDAIKETLNIEEVVRCRSEVMQIVERGLSHFLFTPSEQQPLINAKPVCLPHLAKLFAPFVPSGQSLVFAFRDPAEFAPFVEDLLESRCPSYCELLLIPICNLKASII